MPVLMKICELWIMALFLGESRFLRYDGPLRKAGCGTDL